MALQNKEIILGFSPTLFCRNGQEGMRAAGGKVVGQRVIGWWDKQPAGHPSY